MFFKAFKDAQGDESKIKCFRFLSLLKWVHRASGSWQSKKHVRVEGHANEVWQINPEVVTQVYTHFNAPLFETFLKSC